MRSKKVIALLISLTLLVSSAIPGTLALSTDQAATNGELTVTEETPTPTPEVTETPTPTEEPKPTETPVPSETEKPAETRMGSGKGSPEYWVAVVKPGRVMFEMSGVSEEDAKEAMRLASHKLPIKCKFVKKADEEVSQ